MSTCSARIKITGPVEVQVEDTTRTEEKKKKSKTKKLSRKLKLKISSEESSKETDKNVELDGGVVGGDGGVAEVERTKEGTNRLMMVMTENLVHYPFEQNQELKVCSAWGHRGRAS